MDDVKQMTVMHIFKLYIIFFYSSNNFVHSCPAELLSLSQWVWSWEVENCAVCGWTTKLLMKPQNEIMCDQCGNKKKEQGDHVV